MPTHVEAIVGGEHALVKNLERRFKQRRTNTLQQHRSLLRKVRDQLALAVAEGKLDERRRHRVPCRCTEQSRQAEPARTAAKSPPPSQLSLSLSLHTDLHQVLLI